MQRMQDATLDLGGHSNLEKVSNLLKVTLPKDTKCKGYKMQR